MPFFYKYFAGCTKSVQCWNYEIKNWNLKNKDAALKKKEKDLLHNVKESTDQLNDALVVAENFQLGSRIETKK